MKNIQVFKKGKQIIAIVLRKNFKKSGNTFLCPSDFPEQLAFVSHKKNKVVKPHVHNRYKRTILRTQEIDILKKGRIEVNLYTDDKKCFKSFVLNAGEAVLFASGGHGYRVLKDMDMILVKQGPYAGKKDKTHITEKKVRSNAKKR